jgi:hypothetical protein
MPVQVPARSSSGSSSRATARSCSTLPASMAASSILRRSIACRARRCARGSALRSRRILFIAAGAESHAVEGRRCAIAPARKRAGQGSSTARPRASTSRAMRATAGSAARAARAACRASMGGAAARAGSSSAAEPASIRPAIRRTAERAAWCAREPRRSVTVVPASPRAARDEPRVGGVASMRRQRPITAAHAGWCAPPVRRAAMACAGVRTGSKYAGAAA